MASRHKVIVLPTGQSPTFTLNQPLRERRWPSNYWSSALGGGDSCWPTSAVTTTFKFESGLMGFSGRFIKSLRAFMTSLRIRSCWRHHSSLIRRVDIAEVKNREQLLLF